MNYWLIYLSAAKQKLSLNNVAVNVIQKTGYPYDGKVLITVDPSSAVDGKIKVRIPDWCKSYTATLNGKNAKGESRYGLPGIE